MQRVAPGFDFLVKWRSHGSEKDRFFRRCKVQRAARAQTRINQLHVVKKIKKLNVKSTKNDSRHHIANASHSSNTSHIVQMHQIVQMHHIVRWPSPSSRPQKQVLINTSNTSFVNLFILMAITFFSLFSIGLLDGGSGMRR